MTTQFAVSTLLTHASTVLHNAGIEDARREAEMICAELLSVPRLELYLRSDLTLDDETQKRLSVMLERRSRHEPLQYILGTAYFRELTLEVGPGVLIPRPETELLVDHVIRYAPLRAAVADLGTGSGAIAVSVAFERPDTRVTGVEISDEAIKYARRNAEKYHLANLDIIQGDLLEPLAGQKFDFITANLPYVTEDEFAELDHEVGAHEPALALVAGRDGLSVIRRLIPALPQYLTAGGGVILELGIRQSEEVSSLLAATGCFARIQTIPDYNGHPRFVAAVKIMAQ